MNECKQNMLALIEIDNDVIAELSDLEAPADVQPAIGHLTSSLAELNRVQTTMIRKFIDRQDIKGFEAAGGDGSPIVNAIEGANAAIDEIDLVDPEAGLARTVG
jgi:hypothetical protein